MIRTAVPVKHLDETGLRIAARTRWLHVLCTPFLTVLRIGAGRGDVEKDLEGHCHVNSVASARPVL